MSAPTDAALSQFFSSMRPFLLGEIDAGALEDTLGASRTGRAGLEFYRTLVDRNFHKILRDLYGGVRMAVHAHVELGTQAVRWTHLVRAYAAAHPCAHHDPNEFGRAFPEFLRARLEAGDDLPARLDELADYHWVRHLAGTAPEAATSGPVDDGIDERVFVRMYSDHVPDWSAALHAGTPWTPSERPTAVLVYRHLRTGQVRTFFPSVAALRVVARRQGLDAGTPDDVTARVERELVTRGILPGRPEPLE